MSQETTKKTISISAATFLVILSMVATFIFTAMTLKGERDNRITETATKVENHESRIVSIESTLKTFDKSEVAVLKANIATMSNSMEEMKKETAKYREEQQRFYRKMAAKLGFTFDE